MLEARGATKKQQLRASGDLFRVYNHSVVGAAVTCFDAVVMVGDAGMMLR